MSHPKSPEIKKVENSNTFPNGEGDTLMVEWDCFCGRGRRSHGDCIFLTHSSVSSAFLFGCLWSLGYSNEFTVQPLCHLYLLLVIPVNSRLAFHKSVLIVFRIRIKYFFSFPPNSKPCTPIIFPTYSQLGSFFSLNDGLSFRPFASWVFGLVSFVCVFTRPIIVPGTGAGAETYPPSWVKTKLNLLYPGM